MNSPASATCSRSVVRALLGSATLAAFGVLGLAGTSGIAHAQSCVPPEYANLPIVNTGLPVVQIWTVGLQPVVDRENYIDACMRITNGSKVKYNTGLYTGTLQIRGRGNSTWNMPKKGYRLKLTNSAQILDMPAEKDWSLLANYADKTLLRNNVAMEMSRRVGFAWTPRLRHADFYLNNEFLGSYQIGERVEVGPSRVNITSMTTTDNTPPNVTGGYLLQAEYADRIEPDDAWFASISNRFLMESPEGEDVTPEQKAYIQTWVTNLENAMIRGDYSSSTGVPAYMNLDTLVNYYIVQELTKNKDAAMGSSVFLYKERGQPLRMGPLWDFDISSGNINFYEPAQYPTGWYLRSNSAWFDWLLRSPTFKQRVADRWYQVRSNLHSLIKDYIGQQASMLDGSQKANFQRWPILGTYVWPNQVVTGSYKNEVDWLEDWLHDRYHWMDQHIRE